MRPTKSLVIRAARTVELLVLLSLTLGACSGLNEVTFDVRLDHNLNQDYPLRVDFVVVYDEELYAELKTLSAADWFDQRNRRAKDNAPKNLEINSWEWVPPTCDGCGGPAPRTVDYRLGAQGGIVFAGYSSPGVHRIVIEPLANFTLELGESEVGLGEPRRHEKR